MNSTPQEPISPDDKIEVMVGEFCDKIMELGDSVRVFVARKVGEESSTVTFTDGRGCFYQQQGLIREWLLVQKEKTKMKARDEYEDDNSEDDEE